MHAIEMGGATVGSVVDLIALMQGHVGKFDAARDHRAAFLRVYTVMTEGVFARLNCAHFLDHAWIERVAVRFASYYFDALARFDRGETPPPAWGYAFTVARDRSGFVLQDVLLGMNAHINNDLPQVVAAILRDERETSPSLLLTRRRFDHDQINRVLETIIPSVEDVIAKHDGRLVRPLGRVMGTLDQTMATFGLKTWRDNVWRNAQFLLAADTPSECALVTRFVEADALRVAQQIDQFPALRWCRPLAPLMRRLRLC